MFLHARTSTFNKTAYDPYNNMVRTTLEAFAAAAGGCDSMYVAPFDEAVGRPNDFSMRIARNPQLILQEVDAVGFGQGDEFPANRGDTAAGVRFDPGFVAEKIRPLPGKEAEDAVRVDIE